FFAFPLRGYRNFMAESSRDSLLSRRQPAEVTTTSSSMRTPPAPGR
ncbi:unnamed protein product, partial [marine sediment metagenome]